MIFPIINYRNIIVPKKSNEEIPFSDAVSLWNIERPVADAGTYPKQRGPEYLIGSLDDDGLLRKIWSLSWMNLPSIGGIYTTEEIK